MSDFHGEMTKQILSAPPRSNLSSRYSETAQGRSIPASLRLPTGRSSFEKASGWIRLPRPAAGITPHMSSLLLVCELALARACGALKETNQLDGAPRRAVLVERSLAGALGDALQRAVVDLDRAEGVLFVVGEDDLLAGLKEIADALPHVAQNRRPAGGGFEQASRGTPAHLHHRLAGHVQRQAG